MIDEQQEKKIKAIEQQTHKWDLYAKYFPLLSLVVVSSLWLTGLADINVVFYISLALIVLTSAVWWFWTIKTILHLLNSIQNTSKSFKWIQREFESLKHEIEKIKK